MALALLVGDVGRQNIDGICGIAIQPHMLKLEGICALIATG